jgi:hypothetical protein
MLIWQTSAFERKSVEALAARAIGAAECVRRVDRKGSIILCDQGRAPKGVDERRVTRIFTAGRFGPDAGPWIFMVGIRTPKDWREELCAWYQCEHGPMLLECPDWQGFQFLEASAETGCQFYVLHRLASRTALDADERKRSRATPWFRRLSKNAWFDGPFERVLAHRLTLQWHPKERALA